MNNQQGAESILQGSWRLRSPSPDPPHLTPRRRLAAGCGGADATTLALLMDAGWSQRPDASSPPPHLQHSKAVGGWQFDATLFTGPIPQIFPMSGNKPAWPPCSSARAPSGLWFKQQTCGALGHKDRTQTPWWWVAKENR